MSFRQPGRGYLIQNTTASITLTAADFGKCWSNTGATALITYTLPEPSVATPDANWVKFFSASTVGITVACATSGKMVILNKLTGTNVDLKTASQMAGGSVTVYSNGSVWFVEPCAFSSQTVTST